MKRRPLTNDVLNDFEARLSAWGPLAMCGDSLRAHWESFAYSEDESSVDAARMLPFLSELRAAGVVGEFTRCDVDGATYSVVEAITPAGAVTQRRTAKGSKTAIIPIVGPIVPHGVPFIYKLFGISMASLPEIVGAARAASADPEVGRIVLAIHSPGGSTFGMPEAFAALREVAKRKPVVASINYLGASAAYWLAASAREIVATKSALIGSIGARTRHVSFAEAYKMEGVEVTDISEPASKTDVTEAKPLSESGKRELERLVAASYELFKRDVSATRTLDFEVNGQQYGRVVTANDAKRLKLIDRVVTFDAVLSEGPSVDLPTATRAAHVALLKRK